MLYFFIFAFPWHASLCWQRATFFLPTGFKTPYYVVSIHAYIVPPIAPLRRDRTRAETFLRQFDSKADRIGVSGSTSLSAKTRGSASGLPSSIVALSPQARDLLEEKAQDLLS
jgi:hypothetical protein